MFTSWLWNCVNLVEIRFIKAILFVCGNKLGKIWSWAKLWTVEDVYQSPKSCKMETPLKRYLNGDGFRKQSRHYLRHTCIKYNLAPIKCTYSQLIHTKNEIFNMLTHIFSSKSEIDSVQGIYIEQNCKSKMLDLHSQCGNGVKLWIIIAHFLLSYLLKEDEKTKIMTGRKTRSGQW